MLLNADCAHLELADDEVARLNDACDSRLDVVAGFLWVTIAGERSDLVLGAGDSYVVPSGGEVTLSALRGAAAVEVRARAGAGACWRASPALRARPPSRWQGLLARVSLSSVALA